MTSKECKCLEKDSTQWEQKRGFSNCLHFPETVEVDLITAALNVVQVGQISL